MWQLFYHWTYLSLLRSLSTKGLSYIVQHSRVIPEAGYNGDGFHVMQVIKMFGVLSVNCHLSLKITTLSVKQTQIVHANTEKKCELAKCYKILVFMLLQSLM